MHVRVVRALPTRSGVTVMTVAVCRGDVCVGAFVPAVQPSLVSLLARRRSAWYLCRNDQQPLIEWYVRVAGTLGSDRVCLNVVGMAAVIGRPGVHVAPVTTLLPRQQPSIL